MILLYLVDKDVIKFMIDAFTRMEIQFGKDHDFCPYCVIYMIINLTSIDNVILCFFSWLKKSREPPLKIINLSIT